jgi:hypothetical protein
VCAPEGRQHAGVLRPQPTSAKGDHRVFFEILAGRDDVLAGCDAAQDLDGGLVQRIGVLQHHDAVGAERQHSAGGDAGRLAGRDGKPRRLAHGDGPNHLEEGGAGLSRTEGRGGLNRIPIDGAAGKARKVGVGHDILRQDPAGCFGERNVFRGQPGKGGGEREHLSDIQDFEELFRHQNIQTLIRECGHLL